jgi:antitoxin component YwqK of YwqJK toxin-antitoxin module
VAYSQTTGKPFTGTAEYRTGKGHLVFERSYEDGYETKYTEYYNGDAIRVAKEKYFHSQSSEKKQEIGYSLDGLRRRSTIYDINGKKVSEQTFENNKLVYSCEFKDNKKHGNEFCISEDGIEAEYIYEKGKRIINQ